MATASARQLVRSREVWANAVLFPVLLLGLMWLYSDLLLQTPTGITSLMDFWVTGMAVLGVALGNGHAFLALVATHKASGVLRRIAVTPISPAQLIIGEVVPRVAQAMLVIVVFFAAGRALGAGIVLDASTLQVVPVIALVTATGLSVAFVIVGVTNTPQDANAVDSYTSFPLYLFTGAMFPLAAFPDWLQDVAQFIPYTGLIETVRGIVLDGRALTDFLPEIGIGAGWLVLLLAAAARAYRFVT